MNYKETLNGIDIALCAARNGQEVLMQLILEKEGGIGGMLGHVVGENGSYAVESVWLNDDGKPMVHVNYPSFETDIAFELMSVDEQNCVLKLVLAEI